MPPRSRRRLTPPSKDTSTRDQGEGYTAVLHINFSTETFLHILLWYKPRVYIPTHGGDSEVFGKRKTGDDDRVTDTFLLQTGFSRENCIGLVDIEWMGMNIS